MVRSMNVAVLIAVASAVLAAYVAALSRRLSAAPGWNEQRWFAVAAATVAAYACLDVSGTLSLPAAVVIWCARAQMPLAGLHIYAWIRYSDHQLRSEPGRVRAVLQRLPLVIGVLGLIPGLVFVDALRPRTFAPLGLTYRDVVTTPFGGASMVFQATVFLLVAGRWALAWRRGAPHAGLHLVALAFLCTMSANDALIAAGAFSGMYLIELGFIVPVGAIAYVVTGRFVNDACALAELRSRLEVLVEARTQELTRAREQVSRTEKLALLGRFASRIAHGVNSPAAAAATTLRYALGARSGGGPREAWPEDTAECLQDAIASIDCITRLMQGFRDAGRLAEARGTLQPVRLSTVVSESVHLAVSRCGGRARIAVDVPDEFRVLGQEDPLVHVFANLVANGIEAIPQGRPDGRVSVRCARVVNGLRVSVVDNGAGVSPEVLAHAFDPFFSTKPTGVGSGLGLAVSQLIVQSLGGELRLESRVGKGTSALVDLPELP